MSVQMKRKENVRKKNQREHYPAGGEPKSQQGYQRGEDLKDLSGIAHGSDCVKPEIAVSEGDTRGQR